MVIYPSRRHKKYSQAICAALLACCWCSRLQRSGSSFGATIAGYVNDLAVSGSILGSYGEAGKSDIQIETRAIGYIMFSLVGRRTSSGIYRIFRNQNTHARKFVELRYDNAKQRRLLLKWGRIWTLVLVGR